MHRDERAKKKKTKPAEKKKKKKKNEGTARASPLPPMANCCLDRGGYSIAAVQGLLWEISAFSLALFVWCMFCHGELARTKPQRRQDLTFFYLMLALGGALGGFFVAVAAPNLFSTYLELPIGIVASVLLATLLIYGLTSKKRLIRMGIIACAAFVLPSMSA